MWKHLIIEFFKNGAKLENYRELYDYTILHEDFNTLSLRNLLNNKQKSVECKIWAALSNILI